MHMQFGQNYKLKRGLVKFRLAPIDDHFLWSDDLVTARWFVGAPIEIFSDTESDAYPSS